MNIYEKIAKVRVDFHKANIKKSGNNSYAGYTYYDLSDILPTINSFCESVKLLCVVAFDKEIASLTVIDAEKPSDTVVFTSPMSEANLKGCHAVQNLGAVQTYIKRYLYQNAFEIVEADCLDTPSLEEIDLVNQIHEFANKGVLVGDMLKKADFYIKTRNVEGLHKCVNYCKNPKPADNKGDVNV